MTYDRGPAAETGIYEFPITIEDEHEPPLGQRLPQALEVARRIARHGGVFNVLIHPNILDHKLDFTRSTLAALRPYARFGSVGDFGAWWSAREGLELDTEQRDGRLVIRLVARQAIGDLSLEVPPRWRLDPSAAPGLAAYQDGPQVRTRTVSTCVETALFFVMPHFLTVSRIHLTEKCSMRVDGVGELALKRSD